MMPVISAVTDLIRPKWNLTRFRAGSQNSFTTNKVDYLLKSVHFGLILDNNRSFLKYSF